VGGEFGFETLTLDMDGSDVIKTAPFDHLTRQDVENVLPEFTGTILQVPPIYSAIRRDGTKLYDLARQGKTEEDVDIPPREVEVRRIELVSFDLPKFELDVQCGGGTYIRSLIRDIASRLNTVATVTSLERTEQGQFTLEDCLIKDDWTLDNIFSAVARANAKRKAEAEKEEVCSEE
jgi:tRNA pseudouridine55 synthase